MKHRKPRNELIVITAKIPVWMVEEIEALVRMKRYNSRSDFIRAAIRELLKKEADAIYKEKNIARRGKEVKVIDIE
jgi:Arc/MetJ-type ribon-helix-helix transcriptional regulator